MKTKPPRAIQGRGGSTFVRDGLCLFVDSVYFGGGRTRVTRRRLVLRFIFVIFFVVVLFFLVPGYFVTGCCEDLIRKFGVALWEAAILAGFFGFLGELLG